jgi:hypothetical protein
LSSPASLFLGPADGLGLLPDTLFRGLLVSAASFDLSKDALALHLSLQRSQSLIDVIVPDDDLHLVPWCRV